MNELKFKEGQLLAYGTNGVCIVDEIKPVRLTSEMPENYYVLRQLRDEDSRIFVPVNNERLTSKMRQLLTSEEIHQLVLKVNDDKFEWVKDRRARIEEFKNILAGGVSLELIRMITCIRERIADLDKDGKKLPVTDANTLKAAERLVDEEFSYVLKMETNELRKYLKKTISSGSGDAAY